MLHNPFLNTFLPFLTLIFFYTSSLDLERPNKKEITQLYLSHRVKYDCSELY